MTSGRLVLIFLGIIFLLIVIFSSSHLTLGIRDRLSKILPKSTSNPTQQIASSSPTKTPLSPTPTHEQMAMRLPTKPGPKVVGNSSKTSQIPSTGPEDIVWLLLGGSFIAGIILRSSSFTSNR